MKFSRVREIFPERGSLVRPFSSARNGRGVHCWTARKRSMQRGFAVGLLVLLCPLTACSAERALPEFSVDPSAPPREGQMLSFAPVVDRVAPSVVNVFSRRVVRETSEAPFFGDPLLRRFFGLPESGAPQVPRTQQGLGSGVIVSEDGYIITNRHVVDDSDQIRVALMNGQEYDAEVIGTDPATDLAVIKVEETGLPAITLADSSKLKVGDVVLAVGNPFGVGQTVTQGIISALGRAGFGIVDYEDFIQTDASINPGNSGGALTDTLGRLVGINTAILSRTGGNQGIGFAIPVNMVRFITEQIIQQGRVERGYLGVMIQPLTPELARAFNIEATKGALVANVTPRSPAAHGGLREGDVITAFNGKPVEDSRQLRLMVAQTPPDTRAQVTYLREGKQRAATVVLGELSEDEVAAARGDETRNGETRLRQAGVLPGVEFSNLSDRLRQQLNIPDSVNGLLITSVEAGSAAEQAGLETGDVVVEVNRQPVRNLSDLTAARRNDPDGNLLLRVWSQGGTRYVVISASRQSQG